MPRRTPHDRLFRWLLRLLPFEVRERHGHEMRQVPGEISSETLSSVTTICA